MANRTFTTNRDNYNYSKENINTVANREYNYFNLEVLPYSNSYIRVVINSSITHYNHVGITSIVNRTNILNPRKITIDEARLVLLGGEFEKIGEKDEIIGGGNQKVGSKNK